MRNDIYAYLPMNNSIFYQSFLNLFGNHRVYLLPAIQKLYQINQTKNTTKVHKIFPKINMKIFRFLII